jgi:hypothetical protein
MIALCSLLVTLLVAKIESLFAQAEAIERAGRRCGGGRVQLGAYCLHPLAEASRESLRNRPLHRHRPRPGAPVQGGSEEAEG